MDAVYLELGFLLYKPLIGGVVLVVTSLLGFHFLVSFLILFFLVLFDAAEPPTMRDAVERSGPLTSVAETIIVVAITDCFVAASSMYAWKMIDPKYAPYPDANMRMYLWSQSWETWGQTTLALCLIPIILLACVRAYAFTFYFIMTGIKAIDDFFWPNGNMFVFQTLFAVILMGFILSYYQMKFAQLYDSEK